MSKIKFVKRPKLKIERIIGEKGLYIRKDHIEVPTLFLNFAASSFSKTSGEILTPEEFVSSIRENAIKRSIKKRSGISRRIKRSIIRVTCPKTGRMSKKAVNKIMLNKCVEK